MCDMDGGAEGGFDVGTDSDVSEGTDFESSSDLDAESSFEGMDDVSFAEDSEGDMESLGEEFETDNFDTAMESVNEYSSLDDFDDIGEYDDLSQDEFGPDESESFTDDEITEELFQEDAVQPEMMDVTVLEEMEQENADNPEVLEGINRLIEEGRIEVVDSSEISDEISGEEDDVKVLTREVTEEVRESRERDTEVVLDNYRESLEARGVGEEQISEFLSQERDKINAEYESLDRGDISSNIYEMPSDWDAIAESLSEQGDDSATAERLGDMELSDTTVEETGIEQTEVNLEEDGLYSDLEEITVEEEDTENTISLADLPDIEEMDLSEENEDSINEVSDGQVEDVNAEIETPMEEISEGELENLVDITEDESGEIEEIHIENPVDEGLTEGFSEDTNEEGIEEINENVEVPNEVQETGINYDEIYEGIQQEALEQGFEDIDILADAERLDSTLENFEEANWEGLTLDEQKESMADLAEYVEETIGFDKPPRIEYYNNPREGDYGGYNSETNTLRVNEYMLYNSNEAADTIAHELWHAHQRECAENPQSARDYQYQYNFENYITPELDHHAYENQLLEAEARAFAAQFKGRLANISGRSR